MSRILVSGLINLETTLKIEGFPLAYQPVSYPFFGVNSRVSGVGYNLTRALTSLGHEARFVSLIGRDQAGGLVRQALQTDALNGSFVLDRLDETAQSVILYDGAGRRSIFTDLKNIQDQAYPPEKFDEAAAGCELWALCNINFSRPFLKLARQRGARVATDLHTISDLDDPYNRDFWAAADILFMSDEHLPLPPAEWMRRIWARYTASIVVIGMGAQGALLGLREEERLVMVPAVKTRPVVNTIGAGDALFSAFLHGISCGFTPEEALRRAVVFASWKIGVRSAADGFLTAEELEALVQKV